MPRVQIEGLGTVEFPEGTSPEDMERLSNNALMEKDTGHPATGLPEGTSTPDPITGNRELENKASLWEGLKGMGKGALGTINDANSMSPLEAFSRTDKPLIDVNTKASNPDQMAGKVAEGGLELALPAVKGAEALPSARRAGAVLGSIRDAAEQVPVALNHAAEPMQRLAELGTRGNTLPRAADQLMVRSQGVIPMNFPEARDFYSSLAKPSIMERMATSPEARATLGKLKSAFNSDLADAAETLGRGDEYKNATAEYRNAKRLQKGLAGAGTVAGTAALKGAGLGAAMHVLGKITGQ